MASFSRNKLNLIIALGTLILVVGCMCNPDRNGSGDISRLSDENTSSDRSDSDDTSTSGSDSEDKDRKEDEGDFIVQSTDVENPNFESIHREIKDAKVLEKAADKLNRTLILPHDITLRTKDCGTVNAFYDPRDKSITICYELMSHLFNLYRSDGSTVAEANERMGKAVNFIFLHELGHALIDSYELPITANEEDAADRCSSYICIEEMGDEGVEWVVAAAEAFYIQAQNRKIGKGSLADEHLLEEQRFFNSLCMIYGSNPNKYSGFVEDGLLPEARARRCPSEYARTAKAWESLLEPWRKD
ncbi:MAG: hypothetical protein DWQ47_04130 [Acidobacteria bacterium]|nr:MAG: hypothetical protein DWQ32_07680 [Acidobacteriota bacterium]REK01583.1 MAG: hypothetical protein DWQ38_04115 [Acidobacteriota bacterium]REK14539.1 MAG: hypothetical protein DWQ43_13370 [Acidobacteriota bacterium]REK45254.1 MAG: hypothetical protein DWQ47_04130 [Acidobacteriota bacterium]